MNLSSKEKVLLSFLGAIFSIQCLYLGITLHYCFNNGGKTACPDIGKRAEMTFASQVATVLALITNIGTSRK